MFPGGAFAQLLAEIVHGAWAEWEARGFGLLVLDRCDRWGAGQFYVECV